MALPGIENKFKIPIEEFNELQVGDIVLLRGKGKNRTARVVNAQNRYYPIFYVSSYKRYKVNNPIFRVNYLTPYEVHRNCIVSTQYRWQSQEFELGFSEFRGLRQSQRILDV